MLGLVFGLFAAIFGFWKALFIAICIAVGYLVGKRADEKGNLRSLIERLFGE
ncbi:MAG TPA: DUF2273 domain-containing protein [Clostridia bacterium]|nr:DUF2273 domain-containing protein [Clostridia bacterium]